MSGPSLRATPWSSSRTGPFQRTPVCLAPRRTNHGVPKTAASRSSTRQRPLIRRWLRRTRPPSKWKRRFLPIASTLSRRRPFSRGASCLTAARGCGVSTSSSSPTSTCSRRAARWMASPSGTGDSVRRYGTRTGGRITGRLFAPVRSSLERDLRAPTPRHGEEKAGGAERDAAAARGSDERVANVEAVRARSGVRGQPLVRARHRLHAQPVRLQRDGRVVRRCRLPLDVALDQIRCLRLLPLNPTLNEVGGRGPSSDLVAAQRPGLRRCLTSEDETQGQRESREREDVSSFHVSLHLSGRHLALTLGLVLAGQAAAKP